MKMEEKMLKVNPDLELLLKQGEGFAVTYESLFKNDYVNKIWADDEAKKMIQDLYASKPSFMSYTPIKAIARTTDNNFWLYIDSKKFGAIWRREGTLSSRASKSPNYSN